MKDRHDLLDHFVVIAIKPANVITAQRIRHGVDQASITKRAWTLRLILAALQNVRKIIVGNQRPRHRDRIAIPFRYRLSDKGAILKPRTFRRRKKIVSVCIEIRS